MEMFPKVAVSCQCPGCVIVLQDVTVEGNRVRVMQDLTVLTLTTACEPRIF
jgi:hypothetical protein